MAAYSSIIHTKRVANVAKAKEIGFDGKVAINCEIGDL